MGTNTLNRQLCHVTTLPDHATRVKKLRCLGDGPIKGVQRGAFDSYSTLASFRKQNCQLILALPHIST